MIEGVPQDPFDYPASAIDWMEALPATREYKSPTGLLLVGHGTGEDDMDGLEPHHEGYALECLDALWRIIRAGRHRWLVGGHTHQPMVRIIEGLTVINPGTLVLTQEPGFMIVDFRRGEVARWALLPVLSCVETVKILPGNDGA